MLNLHFNYLIEEIVISFSHDHYLVLYIPLRKHFLNFSYVSFIFLVLRREKYILKFGLNVKYVSIFEFAILFLGSLFEVVYQVIISWTLIFIFVIFTKKTNKLKPVIHTRDNFGFVKTTDYISLFGNEKSFWFSLPNDSIIAIEILLYFLIMKLLVDFWHDGVNIFVDQIHISNT